MQHVTYAADTFASCGMLQCTDCNVQLEERRATHTFATGCSLATLAELARDGARGPFNAFVHTRQLDERMGGLLLPDLLIKPVQACRAH